MIAPNSQILRHSSLSQGAFLAVVVLLLQCFNAPVSAGPSEDARAASSVDNARILATVGEGSITVGQLQDELARRSGGRPGAYADAESRRQVLDEMVERLLLVETAEAAGYRDDPVVQRALEDLMVQRYRQDHEDESLAAIEITEEEVASFYEENRELYRVPPKRRAALLKLPADSQELDRLESRVQELGDKVRHFGPLAAELSHDRATRYRGGDMGYLSPDVNYRWPAAVVEVAMALEEPGQLSDPIEADGFVWLVRLVENETDAFRSLAEVEATIRHELHRQQRRVVRQQLRVGLEEKVKVEIDQDAFESIEAPPEQKPPSLPDNSESSNR